MRISAAVQSCGALNQTCPHSPTHNVAHTHTYTHTCMPTIKSPIDLTCLSRWVFERKLPALWCAGIHVLTFRSVCNSVLVCPTITCSDEGVNVLCRAGACSDRHLRSSYCLSFSLTSTSVSSFTSILSHTRELDGWLSWRDSWQSDLVFDVM